VSENPSAALRMVVEDAELRRLLEAVESSLCRYVVFADPHQVTAVSLWVIHTYVIEAAETTPYLHVFSPVKRAGKTRLLEALGYLVCRPMQVANVTEAVLFRSIEKYHPTLLLDEVDAAFAPRTGNEMLRGLLNAGHRRDNKAFRMGGPKMTEVQEFDTFCPKALAGIGRLPDTVEDRSIPIRLSRRKASEPVTRLRRREVEPIAAALREKIASWAADQSVLDTLRQAWPDLPAIGDRAADGVEPLLALADLAGGEWPARARTAAVALHGGPDIDESLPTRLLGDIRGVFDEVKTDRLATADLVDALMEIDGAPWAELWSASARAELHYRVVGSKLAKMLREFQIAPTKIRDGAVTHQGYRRADFEDAWERYVPPVFEPSSRDEQNNGTPQVDGAISGEEVPTESLPDQACSVVPSSGPEHGISAPNAPVADQPTPPAADPAPRTFDLVETLAAIAEEEARGYSDEVIGVLMATAGWPVPPGFKGWGGYAVRTVRGMR
jgi:Protein of unknown function (DUF3631)